MEDMEVVENDKYLLVSSEGRSHEKKEAATLMGLYEEIGIHNEAKSYRQLHTLSQDTDIGFIYRRSEAWCMSRELGSADPILKVDPLTLNEVPKTGWRYRNDARRCTDHHLRIVTLPTIPPGRDVQISADVDIECLGTYKPFQNLFSCGRRVYKHAEKNYFLLGKLHRKVVCCLDTFSVALDAICWRVNEDPNEKFAVMHR